MIWIHQSLSVVLKVQFCSFKGEICSYVKRVALPLIVDLVFENFSTTGKPFTRSCLFGTIKIDKKIRHFHNCRDFTHVIATSHVIFKTGVREV